MTDFKLKVAAQQSVTRTPKSVGAVAVAAKHAARRDGVRAFKHFSWLEVGSVKVAFPRPAHQRVPRGERAGQAASRWAEIHFTP